MLEQKQAAGLGLSAGNISPASQFSKPRMQLATGLYGATYTELGA